LAAKLSARPRKMSSKRLDVTRSKEPIRSGEEDALSMASEKDDASQSSLLPSLV
jgi:hypothetical protein